MRTPPIDLLRQRFVIESRQDNQIKIGRKKLINFCSNDYLGIGTHPLLKKAFCQGIKQYGLGSGASALVSGFYKSHKMVEEKFADFFQYESAILFNSGYQANISLISTIIGRHDNIVADKLCHASIIEGMQLSHASCIRYAHNDLTHLQEIFSQNKNIKLLITESVFSMEGDISPIQQIINIKKPHDTLLMVDDAHGAGVLGINGRGIIEHLRLNSSDISYLVVPLGKSFASMGAVVLGKKILIDELIQYAKPYRYTTALPPAIACGSLAALTIVEQENWRRKKLQELSAFFNIQAKQRGLPLVSQNLTPIKCILIGDNLRTIKIKENLFKKGFFISAIRPPTVAKGTARIRISLNCMHQEKEIMHLLDLIAEAEQS